MSRCPLYTSNFASRHLASALFMSQVDDTVAKCDKWWLTQCTAGPRADALPIADRASRVCSVIRRRRWPATAASSVPNPHNLSTVSSIDLPIRRCMAFANNWGLELWPRYWIMLSRIRIRDRSRLLTRSTPRSPYDYIYWRSTRHRPLGNHCLALSCDIQSQWCSANSCSRRRLRNVVTPSKSWCRFH